MIIKYNNHLIRIERIIFFDYKIPMDFFIGNNQVIVVNIFIGTVFLSLISNNKTETIELKIENYPYGNSYVNATMPFGDRVSSSCKLKIEINIFNNKILSTMVWFLHAYKI